MKKWCKTISKILEHTPHAIQNLGLVTQPLYPDSLLSYLGDMCFMLGVTECNVACTERLIEKHRNRKLGHETAGKLAIL